MFKKTETLKANIKPGFFMVYNFTSGQRRINHVANVSIETGLPRTVVVLWAYLESDLGICKR